MKTTTIMAIYLACGAATFLIGSTLGIWTATGSFSCRITSHAEQTSYPPPAGDQFEEGPVLVRLPSASPTQPRFIF